MRESLQGLLRGVHVSVNVFICDGCLLIFPSFKRSSLDLVD